MKILIINYNIKPFFAKIDQIGKLKRVNTKIACKFCLGLYVIGVYAKLIDKLVEYAKKAHADKNDNNYAFTSDILSGVSLGGKTGAKCGGKLGGKLG